MLDVVGSDGEARGSTDDVQGHLESNNEFIADAQLPFVASSSTVAVVVTNKEAVLEVDTAGGLSLPGQCTAMNFTNEDIEIDHEDTPQRRYKHKRGPPKRYSPDSPPHATSSAMKELPSASVVTPKRPPTKRGNPRKLGLRIALS